ncbi:FRG domain-containing protein [Luteibacter jiangsuensis]|uniref:FRG domain-containing protein n=2 Tax=Luteibacter jiangsuensis TaxID=637577 RepID=A0ABX0QDN9_9GAMM|nr:FRG domain-containing protein [Luteibacter jiangsuensis]
MDHLQLFGTVERDNVLASVMFTRDRRHNGEAIVHTWVYDPAPEGFAVVVDIQEGPDRSLYVTPKRTYRATSDGALVPVPPAEERADLSQFSAKLKWSGTELHGDWQGPGGGGAVRLKVPDQQTVTVQPLPSWKAFKDWAGTVREMHNVSVFRGHGNSEWRLQTSCTRAGLTRFDRYIDELLPKFRVRAEIALNRQFNPSNRQDFSILLGLAQHHGLPTTSPQF